MLSYINPCVPGHVIPGAFHLGAREDGKLGHLQRGNVCVEDGCRPLLAGHEQRFLCVEAVHCVQKGVPAWQPTGQAGQSRQLDTTGQVTGQAVLLRMSLTSKI